MNRTTTFYQQIEIDLSEVTYATYVLRPMTSQKYWPIRFHEHDLKHSTGKQLLTWLWWWQVDDKSITPDNRPLKIISHLND